MKNILVIGAGRSASTLISYLLSESENEHWKITVADQSKELAEEKIGGHENGVGVGLNVSDENTLSAIISEQHIIISLLPPHLHDVVAVECLRLKKNLVTASYVSAKQKLMHSDLKLQGNIFLCEMGLDPGIDHMSAMEMIHTLKNEHTQIISFKSATGGLVAPECDDNPWNYKISWNPRNVVLAGQATAQFMYNGSVKYLPYHRLFSETEKIKLKGLGNFEAYANRDSLSYIDTYQLQGVQTVVRQTLRREGFAKAWNVLVQLGLTEDQTLIHNASSLTYKQWLAAHLPATTVETEKALKQFLKKINSNHVFDKLKWLGLLDKKHIELQSATAAQILQQLIEKKWKMKTKDKDMIVMRHEIKYKIKSKKYLRESVLVMKGENQTHTAMAKTVGLPLGIAAKHILNKTITETGLVIPVSPSVYTPVLAELKKFGVVFHETDKLISE